MNKNNRNQQSESVCAGPGESELIVEVAAITDTCFDGVSEGVSWDSLLAEEVSR